MTEKWPKSLTLGFMLLASASSVSSAASQDVSSCVADLFAENVARSDFRSHRDLIEYANAFGPLFIDGILKLGPESHIIDMGSGQNNALRSLYAVLDDELPGAIGRVRDQRILDFFRRPASERPYATGVTFSSELPKSMAADPALARYRNGYRIGLKEGPQTRKLLIKSGRLLDEIPEQELSRADMIVDFFGIASYSPHLTETLNRYLRLLKENGEIYLYYSPRRTRIFVPKLKPKTRFGSRVRRFFGNSDYQQISLVEWLNKTPGIHADYLAEASGVVITKHGSHVQLPTLELLDGHTGSPPYRDYRHSEAP